MADDPWWDLTLQEKKRIIEDLWAAELMDDLDMRDDEEEEAAAIAASTTCGGGGGGGPASKRAIVKLHTPTWEEACCCRSKADHDGCVVCLEGLKMGQEFRMMPCSHTFHQLCIFKWLVVNRLCPICQFAMPPPEEDEDQDMVQDETEEDELAAYERYYTPQFMDFIFKNF